MASVKECAKAGSPGGKASTRPKAAGSAEGSGGRKGRRLSALITAALITAAWMAFLPALPLVPPASAQEIDFTDPVSIWSREWPETDFDKASVPFTEIKSGGPPKDGIPAINRPIFRFVTPADKTSLASVISVEINGEVRAYPFSILLWHEIVNDVVGEQPIAVTYCPLCNSAVVFDRRVAGKITTFGTTGKLRKSDLVMYDRATESWWQQFIGEAIIGERLGTKLERVPFRIESLAKYAERHPTGRILQPADEGFRPYGRNPYVGYDSAPFPFLFDGAFEGPLSPLARLVSVGKQAWALDYLRQEERIETDTLILTWEPGRASALDTEDADGGRDVGNVVVARKTEAGGLEPVLYEIPFAFAFSAFVPDGVIFTGDED